MTIQSFAPDLVVEATRVCDRACQGCYAPNVLVPSGRLPSNSDMYLPLDALRTALLKLHEKPALVAVRGGEPSLHPQLEDLLATLRNAADHVVLETHGRWIIGSSQSVLQSLSRLDITIKVSFDKMHGMNAGTLRQTLSHLDQSGISFMVAITEETELEFRNMAALTSEWLSPSRLIFQKKALTEAELIQPRLGVIDSKGLIRKGLTEKFSRPSATKERLAI